MISLPMTIKTKDPVIGPFNGQSHKIKNGDHLVHIYEDKNTLINSVCDFIVPALTVNQGVILISSAENRKGFERTLEKRSIDVAKSKTLGQLIILDAKETLEKMMARGEVHPDKFVNVIGSLISDMNRSYKSIRAYGEMVSLLWNENKQESAIKLEKMWTELATVHQFSLLCGYHFDDKISSEKHPCFSEVCTNHSHIITKDGLLKVSK